MSNKGFKAIWVRGWLQIARRPLLWIAMLVFPLALMLLISTVLENGLPTKVPAVVIDKDGTALSREVTQTLGGMQMVDLKGTVNSYTDARQMLQEGKVYGFFLIPENFEADLMAGRGPALSFYTNMSYFVPGSMLYRTFASTAIYTKAGTVLGVAQSVGVNPDEAEGLVQPVSISVRGIGNPTLNYGVYIGNSFIPGVLQLMILMVTIFTLGEEVKKHTSRRLLQMADGSLLRALVAKLLPQTIIWTVLAFFMLSWLYRYMHYPMNGDWFWMCLSELMYVLACQSLAIFIYGIVPNMRFSLSIAALLGILSFSLSGYSFPPERMYPALQPFCWIFPARYNFLIYADIALGGRHVYYSRVWFAAYCVFYFLPFIVAPLIKKHYRKPVYTP
ncbi:MAG: ABC transporter permease [Muribaculaceae bacterium]|nr:ABC transporter permease [Muribaculaceae bacterium]